VCAAGYTFVTDVRGFGSVPSQCGDRAHAQKSREPSAIVRAIICV